MTTISRASDSWRSHPGDGFDGVALVQTDNAYGSGTLLAGGRAVLTAAHVIEGASAVRVSFDSATGRSAYPVVQVALHSGYRDGRMNDDMALLWLAAPVADHIPRYDLYRGSDELGRVAELVGYGRSGLGSTGATMPGGERYSVHNRFDTTPDALERAVGETLWPASAGSQLLADFDDGTPVRDSLGRLMGRHDTGLGDAEGLIAQGDSGGPAFIDGQVAGVASYIAALTPERGEPLDINDRLDASFGELAGWQRVSFYQSWIDETLAGWQPAETVREDHPSPVLQERAESVALLYAAALDRSPESVGLNYWIGVLNRGESLVTVAGGFTRSEEFITTFGADTDADYITLLYRNALEREPEQAGFNYWQERMESGLSRDEVLIGFALSDENRSNSVWLAGLEFDTGSGHWLV